MAEHPVGPIECGEWLSGFAVGELGWVRHGFQNSFHAVDGGFQFGECSGGFSAAKIALSGPIFRGRLVGFEESLVADFGDAVAADDELLAIGRLDEAFEADAGEAVGAGATGLLGAIGVGDDIFRRADEAEWSAAKASDLEGVFSDVIGAFRFHAWLLLLRNSPARIAEPWFRLGMPVLISMTVPPSPSITFIV